MTQQPAAAVAGAPRAGTASRASVPVVGSARLTMWLLMLLPWLACHCVRKGLPILIEFICQDLGYGEMQKAQPCEIEMGEDGVARCKAGTGVGSR